MPDRIEVKSFREVNIYLRQIMKDIGEIKEGLEDERNALRESRAKRNFMIVTAFIAPIIVTFVSNAIFFPTGR